MKSKLLYILFWAFVALWACSDEPEFPDPGLDSTRTSIDTVRRDTVDSYLISMDISAPNGVECIQVLNGRNYEVIKEFTREYYGKKNFTFEYDVDLREIVNDTTLLYIVKVIDRNMRSYNKGFTLNVKKFSAPDIKIVGGGNILGLVSSVFELKAQFETGLNTIASYKVFFEDEVIDEGAFPDTLMHEYKYRHVIDVDMDMGKEYQLRVELIDNKGTVGKKEMKLLLVEMKRPVKVSVNRNNNKPWRDIEFFYNEEEDRLDSMLYTLYTQVLNPSTGYMEDRISYYRYEFDYTLEGMVSEWRYYTLNQGEEDQLTRRCIFTYEPGTKKLTGVDSDPTSPTTAINVTEWYDHGGVKCYYYGTNSIPVDDIHYVPELKGNGVVFAEHWSSNKAEKWRKYCEDMTPVLIPTYFPELPPVMMGSPDDVWQDLFLYKHVFGEAVYVNQDNTTVSTVTTATDSQGRLTNMRRTISATSYYNYIYYYE